MSRRSREEKEKVAQTAVDELRRKYSELTSSFDQLRNKILAFIAGEIALIAFLFASGVVIPNAIYGIIFYGAGVGLITASFIILSISLRGADWHSPGPSSLLPDKTNLQALTNACNDYSSALETNAPIYARRSKMFDTALMLLLIGVTILIAIKYGQGEVQWQNIIKT